jgi:mitogen-activated protein kinase kinase kinase
MAPEVINQQRYGRKADIWSLGCTIIEMASGRPPWSEVGVNPIAVMMKVAKTDKPPTYPPDISNEMKSFLDACLQIKPEDRWSVKRLVTHPFVKRREQRYLSQNKTGSSRCVKMA